MQSVPQENLKKEIQSTKLQGLFSVPGHFIWDNWALDSRKYDGKIHRYCLCAPKTYRNIQLTPEQRHTHSFIRHAYTMDDGDTWIDTGSCFDENDIHKICKFLWSGSCIVQGVNNTIKFIMFVTAGDGNKEKGFSQKIAVAYSNDGQHWTSLQICLENKEAFHYDFSREDNEDEAWRDPYVFKDHNDNQWHMLFCAKKRKPNNEVVACVGHAIGTKLDDNLYFNNWKLLEGIEIPCKHRQIEMPAVVYKYNYYYLFCCGKTNDHNGSTASYYTFISKHLNTTGWELIYSSEVYCQEKNILHNFGSKIYGTSIFANNDNEIFIVGYYEPYYIGTPIIPVKWNLDKNPPQPYAVFDLFDLQNYSESDNNSNIIVKETSKIQE